MKTILLLIVIFTVALTGVAVGSRAFGRVVFAPLVEAGR